MADSSSLGQSVVGSDALYDFNCSDCLNKRGTSTQAVYFCPECTKYLCKPCFNCIHDVIGRGNVAKWGKPATRDQFEICQKHTTKLIQLYCTKDDAVCCPVCKLSEHKSCGDSVYIPLIANAKENKAGLKKVKKGLGELHLKADKVSKDKATHLTDLDQTEQRLVTGVKEFRAKVNALLDNLEKQSLADIATFKTLLEDRYKSELDICDTIKTEVKTWQNKFDTSIKDDMLQFCHLKLGNEWVRNKSNYLSDIEHFRGFGIVEFEPYKKIETMLKSLQGFGKLMTDSSIDNPVIPESVKDENTHKHGLGSQLSTSDKTDRPAQKTESSVDTPLTPRSGMAAQSNSQDIVSQLFSSGKPNKPAQKTDSLVDSPHITRSGRAIHTFSIGSQPVAPNKPYKTVRKASFEVEEKQDKRSCCIEDMCMMPSGHLILTDNNNYSLKKLNSQYEVISSCTLNLKPDGVCHTEADQVAVALYEHTVQLVTVGDSMTCTSSFTTNHKCDSLAYGNKRLYVLAFCDTSVYVYDLNGTQNRVITKDQHGDQLFFSINHITSNRERSRLHITDDKGLVTIDTRGSLISRFTSDELVGGARGVCTDGEGSVCVGGRGSDNVLQVDGETGKKLGEIIAHRDGISVRRLCFDGVNTKSLVAGSGSTIDVLHLSQ